VVSELNNGNLDENTKQGKVVLDFYADWCAPCKMMEPIIEELAIELDSMMKIGKNPQWGNS